MEDLSGSARLIQAGFFKPSFKEDFPEFFDESKFKELKSSDAEKYKNISFHDFKQELIDKLMKGELKGKKKLYEYADHDEGEVTNHQIRLYDYPKPVNRYSLTLETFHLSIEPVYNFCMNDLKDLGFGDVIKVSDLFAASEQSSLYGAGMQRLGLAQDKVSQFLAQIGAFVRKDLFQLIRDIKWISERIEYHEKARSKEKSESEPAELTLKGMWVDLVDGVVQGQRVSANIFQMAQQLQFTALPDFFFNMNPQTTKDISKTVDDLKLNASLSNVLKRKLEQYLAWRDYNYKELVQRKRFELAYLKQHYNIIKMYMNWLKPYLKHIQRLQPNVKDLTSPNLVSAFEGSMVEIEVLGKMKHPKSDHYTCILLTLEYRTRPSLSFTQEGGYHRGPVHVGETKITWRAYGWDDKKIDAFLKMKDQEDIAVLSGIDEAMNAIKDDIDKYLGEANELSKLRTVEKEDKKSQHKAKKPDSVWAVAGDIGSGFKELGGLFVPSSITGMFSMKSAEQKKAAEASAKAKGNQKVAEKVAKKLLWVHYKIFKKAHGCLAW